MVCTSDITTIDIVNACIGGAGLLISVVLAAGHLWRFRHPLHVSCEKDWTRPNRDGTKREFDAWHVRLLSVRERRVPIDEIWFLGRDGTRIGMVPEDGTSFPLLLSDHEPKDVWYDLDRFSEPGHPRELRCAVVVESGGRKHVAWVDPKPRFWRLRRGPRGGQGMTTAHFIVRSDGVNKAGDQTDEGSEGERPSTSDNG